MAAKKTKTDKELVKVSKDQLVPAQIVESGSRENSEAIDIPEFLKGDNFEREAAAGFPPMVDFANRPGSWILGLFLGQRNEIGPNLSRVYDLHIPKVGQVSLWGSTILDRKMDSVHLEPGKFVYIQYLGVIDTGKPGRQPAKDFRVAIVKDTVAKGAGFSD